MLKKIKRNTPGTTTLSVTCRPMTTPTTGGKGRRERFEIVACLPPPQIEVTKNGVPSIIPRTAI
eukprot:scaffold16780_cov192-Skeletonema_marinoi.AAC.2